MKSSFAAKLNNLTMTPEDWSKLNHMLTNEKYRQVVNEYQSREIALRSTCNLLFKVCRYYDNHNDRCGCSCSCSHKIKAI